ncbi:nucleotidyltransferase domain-containing protein [Xanthomonas arboricola]|uniref:nucleotidyltransferase domain-containing protein n=1 Tax=Xanthomonas arboricola TaxID=56448 RepID=UPI00046403BF|nr:nucleotidyltransferase [Xanthomonas arboricola]
MSAEWEACFGRWAQSPSKTETDKIEHSITAIKKALAARPALATVTRAFVQGSYRNRVNVRQDSDVDIAVIYTGGTFFADYPEGTTRETFGNLPGTYTYAQFKKDIGDALVGYFGPLHVTRGDKAFDVHETTYRVDADVVPVFEHRRYQNAGTYLSGTRLYSDKGVKIINWPDQHYANGNEKNNSTQRAYRKIARIVKKLRNVMDDEGVPEAKPLKGFNVECLIWNVPDALFMHDTLFQDVTAALNYLSTQLSSMGACGEWGEVSDLKYLLKGNETKRQQLKAFIDRGRTRIGIA